MASKSLSLSAASAQYAYISNNSPLQTITGSFTIEVWNRFTTLPADGANMNHAIYKWGATRNYIFNIYRSGSTYYYHGLISSDGNYQAGNDKSQAVTLATGEWIHSAMVFDASVPCFRFFKDGSQVGSDISVSNNSTANTAVQMNVFSAAGGGDYMNGLSDELRLWNVARTAAQINANKSINIDPTTTGLVAYWKFDDTNNDSTNNANHLTYVNTPTYSTTIPTLTDPVTTSIKTFNGLAKASIKTVNGLAIASVKTINGLA